MKNGLLPGFVYDCEIVRNGNVIDRFEEDNILPIEAMQFIASLLLGGGATPTALWYLGLLNTGFLPLADSELSLAAASENVAYTTTSNARLAWTHVYDDAYSITNAAAKAEFAFPSGGIVNGVFLTNGLARGSSGSAVLLSVANFASTRTLEAGDVLRITAGLTLSSV